MRPEKFPNNLNSARAFARAARRKIVMQSSSYAIRGKVGAGILNKADRLFRNDDLGTFVEVLQNSRRAATTLLEVGIEEAQGSSAQCVVTIQDDGTGIRDFDQLLTLRSSGWSADTQTTEDPAA